MMKNARLILTTGCVGAIPQIIWSCSGSNASDVVQWSVYVTSTYRARV